VAATSAVRHCVNLQVLVQQVPFHRGEAGQRAFLTQASATQAPTKPPRGQDRSHETDVVVIGSGIGGLSCAALLARYGVKVTTVDSSKKAPVLRACHL
jgi:NADPH-dependent 2,4-dienoyl-CoA reductase/sulfur reductase-like enzyme